MQSTRALSTMISLKKNNNNVEKLIIEKKKHVKAGKQAGYNKQEEKTGLRQRTKDHVTFAHTLAAHAFVKLT